MREEMVYEYSDCVEQVNNWRQRAVAAQRLSTEQAQKLDGLDDRTPDELFHQDSVRPLVVAFMGGTGVGKSSLLNRLAGHAIARTGVERPTSREVTLYHHQNLNIARLPEGLPLEKIKISSHQNTEYKNILWIDMPDFDSVEQANRELVMKWLAHIDILIYVVSPERYRDGKAWRLLLQEGNKHAWLFVLNKWDLGDSVQAEDFKKQLKLAGFESPVIFKTSCAGNGLEDEFEGLVQHLKTLSEQQTVAFLDQRLKSVRVHQLLQKLNDLRDTLADEKYQQLLNFAKEQWRHSETMFRQAFDWPLKQMAVDYASKAGGRSDIDVWDAWAQSRFDDLIDAIQFKAAQLEIPLPPLKEKLAAIVAQTKQNLENQLELNCRKALVNPGNRIQRWVLKLLKFAEFVLPLSAMGYVSYQVFIGYYESVEQGQPFLGVNFVAHSALMILLSWLIPFFLHKKLQPSLQKTAEQGLKKGVETGLAQLQQQILQAIDSERHQNQMVKQGLEQIIQHCQEGRENMTVSTPEKLRELLMNKKD
jgi:GTPase Era involved in 16S rRNA processing